MIDEETLQRIADTLDPDEIVDRLGLTSERLCDILYVEIVENIDSFYDICGDVLDTDDEGELE